MYAGRLIGFRKYHRSRFSVLSDHFALSPHSNNPFRANFSSHESDAELMFSLVQFDLLPLPDAAIPKRRERARELLTILPRMNTGLLGSVSQTTDFTHDQLPNREERNCARCFGVRARG
jgi:hypothetical protein